LAIGDYALSPLFDDRERVAMEYADRITITDQDVSDEFFDRLRQFFSEDEIVELTATIAWENCSSKFNRALRVESQHLWSCD
jgi:alkylhydroperoxidase family enzyme